MEKKKEVAREKHHRTDSYKLNINIMKYKYNIYKKNI